MDKYMDQAARVYRPACLQDAEDALSYISPDVEREEWALIGMCLKNEFSESARTVFEQWSSGSDKYDATACRDTWRSISSNNSDGPDVTIATLFGKARDGGYHPGKKDYGQAPQQTHPTPAQHQDDGLSVSREMASKYWENCRKGEQHDYATRKGFSEHGLRTNADMLCVPAYDADGNIQSIQRISTSGEKKNLYKTRMKGTYYPIRGNKESIVICEGWATGKSINAATGHGVAVAFGKGGLKPTALLMQQKLPNAQVIIAADADHVDTAEKAALAVGGKVAVPSLNDFNDVHLEEGLESVKEQFAEPSEPVEDKIEIPSFPLDALGPVMASAATAIANMVQSPSHLAGQSILAATALVVQSKANVLIDNRTHPLSVFSLAVGFSGERKSGNDKLALQPHRAWEREQQKFAREETELYKNDLDVWKANRAKALKKGDLSNFPPEPLPPPTGGFIVEEPTLEGLQKAFYFGQPSQGLFSDEGGQFFGGHAMNPDNALKTMAGLSRFWDGSPQHRTRAGTGESWTLYDRRLSAHLMVQPVVAGKVLSDTLMQEQGILARFLISKGDHLFGKRLYQAPKPEDKAAIARYHDAVTKLLDQPCKTDEEGGLILETISPTPEAMELWVNAYNAIESELADGGAFETVRAAASKSAENIARLAGIMAVFNGKSEIDFPTMQNAVRLGDYYLEQYKLCTRVSNDDVAQDHAKKLLSWIKEQGKRTITVDKIRRGAPTVTACRNSVDNSRAMMHRLSESGDVLCIKLNNRNQPSEWEIL